MAMGCTSKMSHTPCISGVDLGVERYSSTVTYGAGTYEESDKGLSVHATLHISFLRQECRPESLGRAAREAVEENRWER